MTAKYLVGELPGIAQYGICDTFHSCTGEPSQAIRGMSTAYLLEKHLMMIDKWQGGDIVGTEITYSMQGRGQCSPGRQPTKWNTTLCRQMIWQMPTNANVMMAFTWQKTNMMISFDLVSNMNLVLIDKTLDLSAEMACLRLNTYSPKECEPVNKSSAEFFHPFWAQLLFLGNPDIQMVASFLYTWVKEPGIGDYKNLQEWWNILRALKPVPNFRNQALVPNHLVGVDSSFPAHCSFQ